MKHLKTILAAIFFAIGLTIVLVAILSPIVLFVFSIYYSISHYEIKFISIFILQATALFFITRGGLVLAFSSMKNEEEAIAVKNKLLKYRIIYLITGVVISIFVTNTFLRQYYLSPGHQAISIKASGTSQRETYEDIRLELGATWQPGFSWLARNSEPKLLYATEHKRDLLECVDDLTTPFLKEREFFTNPPRTCMARLAKKHPTDYTSVSRIESLLTSNVGTYIRSNPSHLAIFLSVWLIMMTANGLSVFAFMVSKVPFLRVFDARISISVLFPEDGADYPNPARVASISKAITGLVFGTIMQIIIFAAGT